jgi:homoserine O-acetyltransferase
MSQSQPHQPPPIAGDFIISDFQFSTGELLPELKLHYTTIGAPRRDEAGITRNAVLILHGTGGSGQAFLRDQFAGVLFGPGQLLDANQYFIILPDGIGHGQSSKPSQGLRTLFPHYTYADMITAQYRLLTEKLEVNHLRLVMGTSMGGMHTWLWGQRYPDFMDVLLPLACLPVEIAGRNRMMRRMIIEAIRTDPEWQQGNYETQPAGLISAIHILILMVSSPHQWQKLASTRQAADKMLAEMVEQYRQQFDANDMLYQLDASREYNPAPYLEQVKAPLYALNFADDQVNPPELGLMEEAIKRVKRGRYILIPTSDQTWGHRTHSIPLVWRQYLAELLRETGTEA